MDSLIYIIQKQSGCIDTSWVVINVQSTLGLEEVLFYSPSSFSLEQNFPNPFNPSTRIEYQLPVSGNVLLQIYDIQGNLVIFESKVLLLLTVIWMIKKLLM